MQRVATYPSASNPPKTFAIAGSLLLVSLSYVLLLAAPVITRQLRAFAVGQSGLKALESWLPLACGAGLVLGGASALMFVLTQITREAARRPYVSLAPVLAAFSACILIGLRAQLPLPGVSAEHVAVFALAVSVIGGALVQTPRMPAQLLGVACTFLPPLSLFGAIWAMSGASDPAGVIWALPAPARAFLGMLTLSSFAIAAAATLVRRPEPETTPSAKAARPARIDPTDLRSRAEPRASTSMDESLSADERALASRGFPSWLLVVVAGGVLGFGFVALKTFLDARAARTLLELPSQQQAALAAPPAVVVSAPVEQALPPPETAPAPQPLKAEPTPRAAAAVVPALEPTPQRSAPRGERSQVHAARDRPVERAAKPAREKVVVAAEPPSQPAVKARSLPEAPAPKPAAARGDESLDELMDNVLKPAKGAKKREQNDDPIFGL